MISGRSRLFTYAAVETLKPGQISSVTHAPPTTSRRSSTSTRRPARARYAAVTRPLCPAPMMITSYIAPTAKSPRIGKQAKVSSARVARQGRGLRIRPDAASIRHQSDTSVKGLKDNYKDNNRDNYKDCPGANESPTPNRRL